MKKILFRMQWCLLGALQSKGHCLRFNIVIDDIFIGQLITIKLFISLE
jgi:hypothetical protein